MLKKLLVFVCVLALAVGVFSVTAAAQTSQDENTFKAGYAIADINPWWSVWADAGNGIPNGYTEENIMPLPMDGYSSGLDRLSLPTLSDDNGDGYITAGIHDTEHPGDGLQATCIAMRKGDTILLLIAVDILRVDDGWGLAAREMIAQATGVPLGNIMISASHTHGSVNMDMSFSSIQSTEYTSDGYTYTGAQIGEYRDAYVTHVKNRLVEVAEAAISAAVPVTAKRGTIQANAYTGKALNSVRHYVQTETYIYKENSFTGNGTETTTTTTYVKGPNFNLDMNSDGTTDTYSDYTVTTTKQIWGSTTTNYSWDGGEQSTPVSTADDSLHLLELIPTAGGKSILLVNWRAHTNTGTKQENKYLSADYVGSLRKALEDQNYLPSFYQGASGNLGNFDNSVETTAWYREGATTYAERSVNYGTTLATAALALLQGDDHSAVTAPMETVATGAIRTQNIPYSFEGRFISEDERTAAENHLADTNCSTTKNNAPCVHTVNGQTYVFASNYHASSVKEIAGYGTWSHAADINVLTVGDAIVFVTAPFELSDRYSMDATLATANQYNDWDALAEVGFGTPFVLSCTNEYWKYLPNNLAYNYGTHGIATYERQDRFALGCYESQIAYMTAGTGEELLEIYQEALTELHNTVIADCKCCGASDVQWTPLTAQLLNQNSQQLPAGHYYLAEPLHYSEQVNISGAQVCLDLNGNAYQATGAARAFSVTSGGVFRVMDSSKTGRILGSPDCTAGSGGVIYVDSATFNLYSGTVAGGYATSYGGNIFVYNGGTFNMYGGAVEGGSVGSSGAGGNLCTAAATNFGMYGGMIRGGTVNANANQFNSNVYAQGNVVLFGTTAGDEALQLGIRDRTRITIDGTYTGKVNIWPGTGLTVQESTVVGEGINDPNLSGAQITVQGYDNMTLKLDGDNNLLFAIPVTLASIQTSSGTVYYETLQAAADAWWQMHNPAPIKLEQAAAGQGLHVNLTVDVQLDLNGVQLGSLTVSGTGKVLCMDSTTDDYTVSGGYGTVPAGTGFQAADGYMMIDDDGIVSFHKVQNRITSINLRPSNVGLYYGSQFAGDEMVKSNVAEYGIALRIGNEPTESYITGDTQNKYHVPFDREAWVTGTGTSSSYGTLLYGIMTPGDASNALYATANVYGVTYIKTADGQMHLSDAKVFTLKQVVETIDGMWNSLDSTQKSHIQTMYRKYKSVMSSWNIPNIRTAAGETVETPETTENTLKILAIGNSFSNDTTRLLEVIAEAEGYENVMIGNLYYSGCNLNQHVGFAQNDEEVYRFYRNYNGQWTQEEGWTLRKGLQDQDWDIITLQQGSVHSGLPQWYEDYLTQLIAYVNENKTNPDAKLAWNMTWAYQQDSTHDYFYLYDNDQMTMYNAIINAVKQEVVPHSEFSYIIPAGTAIQNVRTSYIGDNLTRDGYHLNDLGRVITAYTWLCTLTGVDRLDEIKLDTIPAALTNAPVSDTDRELTGIEKNIIMEAVNNALASPMKITQSRYTQAPAN